MLPRRVFVTQHLPDAVWMGIDDEAMHNGKLEVVTAARAVAPGDLLAEAARSHALVITVNDRLNADFFTLLDPASPLRAVSTMSTGVDHIALAAAKAHDVQVLWLPNSITGVATAELTWALVLAVARGTVRAAEDFKAGRWSAWDAWQWNGVQLDGATLGVVGFGTIGSKVASFGRAFGMKVLATTHRVPPERPRGDIEFVGLFDLANRSDVVCVHVPLTDQTRGLIGPEFLMHIRPGAILVNSARGAVVDPEALLAALDSGRIGGVGLDVYAQEPASVDDPLVNHPRVLALPHIGSATRETRTEMATRAVLAAVNAVSQLASGVQSVAHQS